MHNRLQRLYQGGKNVDEYHKKLEICLMRAKMSDSQEATMTIFLHGLNRDIQDIVELQSYTNLNELVHRSIKVKNN